MGSDSNNSSSSRRRAQLQTASFSIFAIALQVLFIILFGVFVRYPGLGIPLTGSALNDSDSDSEGHGQNSMTEVGNYYPCESFIMA